MKSIDIFDTALFRDVYEPRDVFSCVSEDFRARRIEAERVAATKNPFYTIDDIYRELPGFDKRTELALECARTRANPDILGMYNRSPNAFVFVSDMYLPSPVLCRLLVAAGYKRPRVIVSCEAKAVKSDGGLFRKAGEQFGKLTVHYDDNYSCIAGAQKAGIRGVYVPRPRCEAKLDNSFLRRAIADASVEPVEYRVGFPFGAVAWAFLEWLKAKKMPGRPVFFVARDCFIFHELADFDSQYIYISRDSLTTDGARGYLEGLGLRDGDILADLGYSGTSQKRIEEILGIRLRGKYMFTSNKKNGVDREAFFPDVSIVGPNIGAYEMIFTSPAGKTIGYRAGEPVFQSWREKRPATTKRILQGIRDGCEAVRAMPKKPTREDCEKIIKFFLRSPEPSFCRLFNRAFLERGVPLIGYNEKRIAAGHLFDDYSRSFFRSGYLELLKAGPFARLARAVNPPDNDTFLNDPRAIEALAALQVRQEPFGFYGCGTLLCAIVERFPALVSNPAWILTVDRADVGAEAFGRRIVKPEAVPQGLPLFIAILYQKEVFDELAKKGLNASRLT